MGLKENVAGIWCEKENVAGIWLFKACWGKRYVAVACSSEVPVTSSVPPSFSRIGPNGPGWESEVRSAKKRIIRPFLVQSTLSGSIGPNFGFWALKENYFHITNAEYFV